MSIKWSALGVNNALDEIDALLEKAEPIFNEALRAIEKALAIPNLPQYISQNLIRLQLMLENQARSGHNQVESIRGKLPVDAIEAERRMREIGVQQKLEW